MPVFGPNGHGLKPIYATSIDKFDEPEGPRASRRLMKLFPVPENHELGQDGLWDRIRDQIFELLNERSIKLTSINLVQFTWLDKKDDSDNDMQNDDSEILSIKDGKRHTTNPTIWVGVLPDTLTGMITCESATDILGLLKKLGVAGVDIVYHESLTKSLHGPDLFAPASDEDPLKDLIDNLSTSLSLPIAG